MKKVILGVVAALMAVGFAATGDNPPVVGRIAQQLGQPGTVTWSVVDSNEYTLVLGDTTLPAGVFITQEGTNLTFHLAPETDGNFVIDMALQLYGKPPIPDWNGPLFERTYPSRIEWYVLPAVTDPFSPGLGDTVVTPTP